MNTTATTTDCACGNPITIDDGSGQCTPCRRDNRRNSITPNRLHDIEPTATTPAARPVIDRERHRTVDRAMARLTAVDELLTLARSLHHAINVDASNPSNPDGYPTSTPGARPATGRTPAATNPNCTECRAASERTPCGKHQTPRADCDECRRTLAACDEHGNVTLTTVEAGTARLLNPPTRRSEDRDRYHDLTQQALTNIERAGAAIAGATEAIAQLAKLQDAAGLKDGEPGCWALARVASWEPIHATVIIDGDPRPLGKWAWELYRRTGQLPTLTDCRRHLAGQRIVTRDTSNPRAS